MSQEASSVDLSANPKACFVPAPLDNASATKATTPVDRVQVEARTQEPVIPTPEHPSDYYPAETDKPTSRVASPAMTSSTCPSPAIDGLSFVKRDRENSESQRHHTRTPPKKAAKIAIPSSPSESSAAGATIASAGATAAATPTFSVLPPAQGRDTIPLSGTPCEAGTPPPPTDAVTKESAVDAVVEGKEGGPALMGSA